MALRTVLLLLSLVGCGLCWRRPIDFPDVKKWPAMPVPGMELEKTEANPLVCEACEVVVEEVQKFLGNDSKKIIAFLEQFCNLLPSPYNGTCDEYVTEWAPIIIDFLENQTPEEVCQDLTLCAEAAVSRQETSRFNFGRLLRFLHKNVKKNFNKLMIKNALGNNFLCEGCDMVVEYLHDLLTNKQILDELVALLSEGCILCPVEAQCRAYFQALPGEIEALVNQFLNNQTCKMLGFCTSSAPENPWLMFSRLFTESLPENFDRDFPAGRPWSRRHPYKPHHSGEDRRNGSTERPDREHGHGHHEHHDRPHPRPHHPHHGPHHRPNWNMPRPDVRPWRNPGMKPYKPRPEAEDPEVVTPEMEAPTADDTPDFDIPVNFQVPEFEIPEVQIPDVNLKPNRREPIDPSRQKPWGQGWTRKGGYPSKARGTWRNRRAVSISTVINAEDFDQTNTFDVEPANEKVEKPVKEPVEISWQCEVCEYEVDVLQKYMEAHKETINQELLSVVSLFCERLPATTSAECKTEFADVLPPIVDMIIDTYMTPSTVCTALQVC